jgi:membrane-associated phospholipid phosphatase
VHWYLRCVVRVLPSVRGWTIAAVGAVVFVAAAVVGEPEWAVDVERVAMQAGTRLAVVVVGVLLVLVQRRIAIAAVIAGASAWAVAIVAKNTFALDRPTATTLGRPVREVVSGFGFPSSHAAIATALATAVIVGRPGPPRWLVPIAVVLPLLTALGRVAIGAHWPSDVVGGAAIGVVCGAVVAGR